jgi:KUP system potassium uptake protein
MAVVSEEGQSKSSFRALLLGCIGVVYGDIGTSPLYAFREAANHVSGDGNILPVEIYGLLSLIIWSLIIIVTFKYVLFLLKIDNRGEGGILSLMTVARKAPGISVPVVFGLGMLGAGLFYGDSAITPAISVLSAVEGLKIAAPSLEHFVLPIALVIIIVLFMVQKHGTDKISKLFGPITAVWFLAIAGVGVSWIIKHPEILFSFSPTYALEFVLHHGWVSFFVLSSICLAVTGAEALYADMGHFGRKPIQVAWLYFVFPCLVLNYLGQGALLLDNPGAIENTFYLLVPAWGLLPMVGLATMATIIASQAVITGAYSISRQAIQLGFLPRMEIVHTSADQHGQIYMPQINRWLLYTIVLLCLIFGTSSNLAAAYGIAVMGTMVVSSVLAFIVVWKVKQKSLLKACVFLLPLFVFEGLYLASNMVKLMDGGFVPLFIAGFTVTSMFVWVKGTAYLHKKAKRQAVPLSDLMERLDRNPPVTVDGTAVYMTSDPADAPIAMLQNLKHNKVLHKKNIVLSVVNSQYSKVPDNQRIVVDRVSSGITKLYVHYGFMETPHIPTALLMAKSYGVDSDLDNVSYFLGRRSIVPDPLRGLPAWQEHIFLILLKSSTAATDFYKLPADRVVELGVQMAI